MVAVDGACRTAVIDAAKWALDTHVP
jgi:hypothetical protein